jgi:hypothetical protein
MFQLGGHPFRYQSEVFLGSSPTQGNHRMVMMMVECAGHVRHKPKL